MHNHICMHNPPLFSLVGTYRIDTGGFYIRRAGSEGGGLLDEASSYMAKESEEDGER